VAAAAAGTCLMLLMFNASYVYVCVCVYVCVLCVCARAREGSSGGGGGRYVVQYCNFFVLRLVVQRHVTRPFRVASVRVHKSHCRPLSNVTLH
jgi:hypothetical protein